MTSGTEISDMNIDRTNDSHVITRSPARVVLYSALLTALCLVGGMLLAFILGFSISELPMHVPERMMALFSSIPALLILVVASAGWGEILGRLVASPHKRRLRLTGGLSFTPMLILAAFVLGQLEVLIVEKRQGPELPIHVIFTALFVPATALVAGVCSFVLALAYGGLRPAIQAGLFAGLLAGLGFLVVDLLMDAAGYRVGAPGAAERFTMITVMLAGSLGAALAGGAALGVVLARKPERG